MQNGMTYRGTDEYKKSIITAQLAGINIYLDARLKVQKILAA